MSGQRGIRFTCVVAAAVTCGMLVGCGTEAGSDSDGWLTRLTSLGYVRSTEADSEGGVQVCDPQRVQEGVNLYTVSEDRQCLLLDVQGRVLHKLVDRRPSPSGVWEIVKPYDDETFLVIVQDQSMMRIDWDSRVLWELRLPFHHDLAIADNGDIYAPIKRLAFYPALLPEPAEYDALIVVSPAGKVKSQIPLVKFLTPVPELVEVMRNQQFSLDEDRDPMHTNTIEILPRDVIIDGQTVFRRGQILFCMRNMDLIGVIDLKEQRLVWYWGPGELDRPHCPTLLDNNRLLVFDNGFRRKYSRVIELDPLHGTIQHEIRGNDPATPFFSEVMGHAQRLPNGNTLIVASTQARVIEVSPDGRLVWEFYSFPLQSDPRRLNRPMRMPRLVNVPEKWRRHAAL